MENTSILRILCLIGALLGFVGLYSILGIFELTGFTVATLIPLSLALISSLFLTYQAFKPVKNR